MIHLTVRNSGTLGILTLRGNLSGLHAVDLREHLLRCLDRASRVIVNCEQVTSIDMACLKLLCTAYRLSCTMKKDFALAGDSTHVFRLAGGPAAYIECARTDQRCAKGCLWADRERGSDTLGSAAAQNIAA